MLPFVRDAIFQLCYLIFKKCPIFHPRLTPVTLASAKTLMACSTQPPLHWPAPCVHCHFIRLNWPLLRLTKWTLFLLFQSQHNFLSPSRHTLSFLRVISWKHPNNLHSPSHSLVLHVHSWAPSVSSVAHTSLRRHTLTSLVSAVITWEQVYLLLHSNNSFLSFAPINCAPGHAQHHLLLSPSLSLCFVLPWLFQFISFTLFYWIFTRCSIRFTRLDSTCSSLLSTWWHPRLVPCFYHSLSALRQTCNSLWIKKYKSKHFYSSISFVCCLKNTFLLTTYAFSFFLPLFLPFFIHSPCIRP